MRSTLMHAFQHLYQAQVICTMSFKLYKTVISVKILSESCPTCLRSVWSSSNANLLA